MESLIADNVVIEHYIGGQHQNKSMIHFIREIQLV